MKRRYKVHTGQSIIEREYNYIPVRYIIAVLITLFEVLAVIGAVVACCYFIPYFYIAAYLTEIFCVINIIAADDNPDYKVPWLLFVLILPIGGFMLYFLFYSRKPDGRYAMIGTINLDYRSLVHHFENGVWMYGCDAIRDLKADIDETLLMSKEITPADLKTGLFTRLLRAVARIFAPML